MAWRALLVSCTVWMCCGAMAQPASVLAGLQQARAQGCGARAAPAQPLRPMVELDEAARRIARGEPALQAARDAGAPSTRIFQARFTGHATAAGVVQALRERYCDALADPSLTTFGVHREGSSWWVVLAAPLASPGPADAVAARVLALTNAARSVARRCGGRFQPAAPPLRHDGALETAAISHARDMAAHSFLDHRGSDGSEPAQRVERAGYDWRTVGENVAAGQQTAEDVVAQWLASPPHCENLMAAQFTEMGTGFASNPRSPQGVYWAQVFGRRRGN